MTKEERRMYMREYMKTYRKSEKRKQYAREYYIKNRERILGVQKTYYKNGGKEKKEEYSKSEKIKTYRRAIKVLRRAIERGEVKKRNICETCYAQPTHCHHEDYSKPLDFVELCHKCHMFLHSQDRENLAFTKSLTV